MISRSPWAESIKRIPLGSDFARLPVTTSLLGERSRDECPYRPSLPVTKRREADTKRRWLETADEAVVSFLTNEQPTLSVAPPYLGTTTATTSHPQETDCGRNDSGGRSRSRSRCCSEERRRAGLEAAA